VKGGFPRKKLLTIFVKLLIISVNHKEVLIHRKYDRRDKAKTIEEYHGCPLVAKRQELTKLNPVSGK